MTRKEKAIQLGKAKAEHMFEDFRNVFTGEDCGESASVELFLYFGDWNRMKPAQKKELKNLAYESAKVRWNELVASQVEGV
jgi:hypothetical protein